MIEHIKYEDIDNGDNGDIDVLKNITYQRRLFTKIVNYRNIYLFNEFITNARIGTILQNSSAYTYINMKSTISLQTTTEPYSFGTLFGINIYIDPLLTWTDNRILIKEDKIILRRKKLDKILNKKSNIKYLEEIIIDEKIIDMLL